MSHDDLAHRQLTRESTGYGSCRLSTIYLYSIAVFTDPAGGNSRFAISLAMEQNLRMRRTCCTRPVCGTGTGAGIPRYVRGMRKPRSRPTSARSEGIILDEC